MTETTILTLNNGKQYEVLMEDQLEGKKYYLVSELNEQEEDIGNYSFFESHFHNGNEIVRQVQDKELIEQLTVLFTARYSQITDLLGGNN